ncbi:hypothetical protein ILUMI_03795 [Ignelater luminosus]|uniref:Uncharacterized protein n=1 Tax=Ignelater luminosus TaxID=2038154 RepID=A0A8K0GLU1_IGNLU|nr:hypothetical protein ILUMI_03795 [Ignelater luminosus]
MRFFHFLQSIFLVSVFQYHAVLADLLQEKIRYLWEKLDEDPKYSNEFIQKHSGNTLNTLEALKKQLKSMKLLEDLTSKCLLKIQGKSWSSYGTNVILLIPKGTLNFSMKICTLKIC